MTYTYTEDSYKVSYLSPVTSPSLYTLTSQQVFSASALAGIGLIRNTAGAGFPLFGRQMFLNEGYQWAGSILGFLALLLVPIPFILATYGRSLRLKPPWAKQHMDDLTEEEGTGKVSSEEG